MQHKGTRARALYNLSECCISGEQLVSIGASESLVETPILVGGWAKVVWNLERRADSH